MAQPELGQRQRGALLDVPVRPDKVVQVRVGVTVEDAMQRAARPGNAEELVEPVGNLGVQSLREIRREPNDRHRSPGGCQLTGEQPQQGRLATAVGADQTRAPGREGDIETIEDALSIRPAEGEVRTQDGGLRHSGAPEASRSAPAVGRRRDGTHTSTAALLRRRQGRVTRYPWDRRAGERVFVAVPPAVSGALCASARCPGMATLGRPGSRPVCTTEYSGRSAHR